jgi:filamentous hemagglutinin family protein
VNKRARSILLSRNTVAVAVASCFAANGAIANPTAPTVVHGSAAFQQHGSLLQITNSPNTIINWGGFSIGAGEITRFIQQSSASAVLNRVIGQDPSSILGALQSNGRVFLINPNGILFGAGAQVDVAGLVASTLNLSNADFLAGRLKFSELSGAGSIVNQGSITTGSGGSVYLVAPSVTNAGVITSPQGEVILSAGNSVELVNPGTPNLRVEISAPDNEARNLGQIAADAGRVGIYAGLINHSGMIRADSAVAGENGQILLKASKNTTLEAGSVTSANGPSGGRIDIQSGDTTLVSGTVEAKGSSIDAAGHGGTIHVLGNKVGLINQARIDASGESGGGTVLVGGDFQGRNPAIQNAFRTFFGPDARIAADAVTSGDGGKVIVWSDDATRAYGRIFARGGAQSGNGGFAEVSGKNYLDYRGLTDLSAPAGTTGTLLLDPSNIVIDNSSDSFLGGLLDGLLGIFSGAAGTATITWNTIKNQLATTNTTITTTGGGGAGTITVSANSPDLTTSNALRLLAHSNITVNGAITNTGAGAVEMYAGWDGASTAAPVVSSSGSIALNAPMTLAGDALLIASDSITQLATAPITANRLAARAGDEVALSSATNMVNVLAGAADDCCSTRFDFRNGKNLTIGSAGGFNGITASDNDGSPVINVSVTSGALTVDQPVSAIDGQVLLTAAGTVNVNNNVTATLSQGPVNITGSSIAVASGVMVGVSSTSGGPAVSLNATNGGITIQDGATLVASVAGGSGGGSTVTLNAAGGGITIGNAAVNATGGSVLVGQGGPASISMTASGGVTLAGTTVTATGGNTGDMLQGAGGADIIIAAGGTIDLTGSMLTASGGINSSSGPNGLGTVALEVSTGSGNPAASGNIIAHNITADNVAMQQSSVSALNGNSILRAAPASLIQANQISFEVDAVSGASIGTAGEPMRIQANRLEAYTTNASPGIFIESPNSGNLQIGGVNFYNGSFKGVQNITSGDVKLRVNGGLTVSAGTAGCGSVPAGTGGPVCTGSGTIALHADTMTLANVVNAGSSGTVALAPFATNRDIRIEGTPTAGVLSLSVPSLALITAGVLEIGRSSDTGSLTVNSAVSSADIKAGTFKLAHQNINLSQPVDFSAENENVFLTAGAGGTISQSAVGVITTGGHTTLNAGTTITLAGANDFGSVKIGSGTEVRLNDTSAIVLDGATTTGTLSVTSGGAITQSAPIIQTGAGGTVTLNAGVNAITLTDAGNDFTGTVLLVGSSVSIMDANAITLGPLNTSSLSVTAASIGQAGTFVVSGPSTFRGGTVVLNDAGNDFTGPVSLNSSGAGNVAVTDSNGIVLETSLLGSGTLTVNASGAITQTGPITQTAGAGAAKFNAGANPIVLTDPGNDFTGPVSLSNSGPNQVAVSDVNGLSLGPSSLGTGGLFVISGAPVTITAGTTLSSAGGFNVVGGTVNVAGTLDTGSSAITAPAINMLSGGMLQGTGTVNGNVNNMTGTVAPGASPGILTINGDYVQGPSGVLSIDIGGTTPGTLHDQLRVNGNVTLQPGATLQTTLINGFGPAPGSSFNVIQSTGSVSGTFTNAQFPTGSGLSLNYLASNVDVLAPLQTAVTGPLEPQIVAVERALETIQLGQNLPGQDKPSDVTLDGVPVCR